MNLTNILHILDGNYVIVSRDCSGRFKSLKPMEIRNGCLYRVSGEGNKVFRLMDTISIGGSHCFRVRHHDENPVMVHPTMLRRATKRQVEKYLKPKAAKKTIEFHNPDNLTPEQVEVEKGWRLITKKELGSRQINGCVAAWLPSLRIWSPKADYNGDTEHITYRTRLPLPFSNQSLN